MNDRVSSGARRADRTRQQTATVRKVWVGRGGLDPRRLPSRARVPRGGCFFSFFLPGASERVILSAAGAKDLLLPERARGTGAGAKTADPSLARGARSLRMTTPRRVCGK